MYRILIVDDEPFVVDEINNLIGSQLDVEVDICKAFSAPEAINWLKRAKIDILISDICMPKTNGIELLEQVNQMWPDCKVIFLTGHADFEYAYEAIKRNVVAYLLKTEDDGAILVAIKKAIELIDTQIKNTELINVAKKSVDEALPILKNQFIRNFIEGKIVDTLYIKTHISRFSISLDIKKPVLLILGRIENLDDDMNEIERIEEISSINGIVEHYFSKYATQIVLDYDKNIIIWLLQPMIEHLKYDEITSEVYDAEELQQFVVYSTAVLEDVQKSCRNNKDKILTFVLDSKLCKYNDISNRFNVLKSILDAFMVSDEGAILNDSALIGLHKPVLIADTIKQQESNQFFQKVESLQSFLNSSKRDSFTELLTEIGQVLKDSKSRNDSFAQEIYLRVSIILLSYINRKKLGEQLAFHIGLNKLTRYDLHKSWEEAVRYFKNLGDAIFDLQMEYSNQFTVDIVQAVKQYILKHLCEDISLVKLSEVAGYNPSYLSRLYKMTTGETLQDFINASRLAKTKELLANEGNSINDIIALAGFESRAYFNRFFKKMTNMTPQEYRKNLV